MKVAAELLLPDEIIPTECKAVVVRLTGEIGTAWINIFNIDIGVLESLIG